jgi:hypothetical protein
MKPSDRRLQFGEIHRFREEHVKLLSVCISTRGGRWQWPTYEGGTGPLRPKGAMSPVQSSHWWLGRAYEQFSAASARERRKPRAEKARSAVSGVTQLANTAPHGQRTRTW